MSSGKISQAVAAIIDDRGNLIGWPSRESMDFGAVMVIGQQNVATTAPNDTNENTLYTLNIPGGLMGPNDSLRVSAHWSCTNNANAKTLKVKHGSNTVLNTPAASGAGAIQNVKTTNRNSLSSQICGSIGSGTTGTIATYSLDTSQPQTLTITAQKSTAGDSIVLESAMVELIRGA